MTVPHVVIIGASSAIAEQIARLYAVQNASFFLVARNQKKLDDIASDLNIRGANTVNCMTADLNELSLHPEIVTKSFECLGHVTHLFVAYGTLPDNMACEKDPRLAIKEINLNQLSPISIILYFSRRLEEQKSGTIVALSSVAGDRGRQSNYIYGAAKGGLSIFMQGLRNRLYENNVKVITVKPGFVDTPMTANFNKGLLWATPKKVASIIVKGVARKRDTIYAPAFWRIIMLVIIHIPEFIFKRLKL